jgi:hypothetical protein
MGDSCGTGRQVRHLYVKRTNVAHRLPRGKRASGTEINYFQKQQSVIKQPNKKSPASDSTSLSRAFFLILFYFFTILFKDFGEHFIHDRHDD